MPTAILAHFLPELTTPDALTGGTVVVIDVLRASTTITYALASGCVSDPLPGSRRSPPDCRDVSSGAGRAWR